MATLLTDTVIPGFEGELLTPGTPGYAAARSHDRGPAQHRPALIARCTSTADVRLAVCHAVLTGTRPAVRGGECGTVGPGLGDGGLVIDLSALREVRIDAVARAAVAGAGATWGDLDTACAAKGLALANGQAPTGDGWLGRSLAPAAGALLAAELVTAQGQVLRADARTQPELLWGLRAGCGTLGVLTSCTFRLHAVPPRAPAGTLLRPMERAAEVARAVRDLAEATPAGLRVAISMLTAPARDAEATPSAAEAARLQALRQRWDPQDVFAGQGSVHPGG